MKILFYPAILMILISGCKSENKKTVPPSLSFEQYKEHFIERLWLQYPDWASGEGYHKYDSLLIVPNDESRENEKGFIARELDNLSNFKIEKLSAANQIDYHLIQNQLLSSRWQSDTLKSGEWDPSSYNVIGNFALILNEQYAPLNKRLKSFYEKLANVPSYYEAAKLNIKNPVIELTTLAIDQHLGGVDVFEKDFIDSLKKSTLPENEKILMQNRALLAVDAIKKYAQWLKNLKNPEPRSFRLGKDLYAKKFNYDIQSTFTAQHIYDSAKVRKKYLHQKMFALSQQLWPKYFGTSKIPADTLEAIKKMIDILSIHHTKPEEFQSTIEKSIPALVAFVKEKDLLYIDPSKPLVIRKEPAYMAGVAGASVSAPGPYDKNGNTYYNVGSLSGWPKEKAESYLREYNDYMLQILCIHEAIPGHYTQLVYANQSPSLIKSILSNGAMIEGWAVYTEQLMLENGYANNAPEMWLMWYKWNLRSVCNTILDYSVHAGNMQRDEAIKMLTAEAFQQQAEAVGKWRRVSVTSVQLTSYYTGYKEIVELRNTYQKKMGDRYKVKEFNEKFLSYGNSPVKYIRELMLID